MNVVQYSAAALPAARPACLNSEGMRSSAVLPRWLACADESAERDSFATCPDSPGTAP
jgi:hypothetical protein